MELMEQEQQVVRKVGSLTCAEIGLLVGGYRPGTAELSVPGDIVYVAALIVFDLYEAGLVDLLLRVKGQNISLKISDDDAFRSLEVLDRFDAVYALLVFPTGLKPPRAMPDGEQQFYERLIEMSSMFGGISPIVLYDLLVCCKSRLDFSLCIINCRNWILAELQAKKLLEVSRKLIVFSKYTLTEQGVQYCSFLSSRVNYVFSQQYEQQPEDFPQFSTSMNFRNVYFVCHVIPHIGKKYLQKSTNICGETRKKFITYQASLANNVGNLLRQPKLKLQPANMEAWFVAMCSVTGLCTSYAIKATSKY